MRGCWLILLFPLLLAACEETDLEQVEALTSEQNMPQEVGREVEILYSDSAQLEARVTAPVMLTFGGKDPYYEMPEGVNVKFYSSGSKVVSSSMRSDYAIRHINSKRTVMTGDVVVVNEGGDTLNTERLVWEENKDRIHSDEFVRVRTADEIIFSEGFESNSAFTAYQFWNVTGTITLPEEEF